MEYSRGSRKRTTFENGRCPQLEQTAYGNDPCKRRIQMEFCQGGRLTRVSPQRALTVLTKLILATALAVTQYFSENKNIAQQTIQSW